MINQSFKHKQSKAVRTFVSPLFFMILNLFVLFLIIMIFIQPYFKIASMLLNNNRNNESEIFFENRDFLDQAEVSNLDVKSPYVGTHYGQISIERVELDVKLYWGDTDEILDKGAGQYIGSSLPGYRKPLLIAGHNLTFFKPLRDVIVGDTIEVETHYASYIYEVVKTDIVNYLDMEAFDLSVEDEVLMLYTCYPFEILWSRKTDRFVVYAKRIEGPDVK